MKASTLLVAGALSLLTAGSAFTQSNQTPSQFSVPASATAARSGYLLGSDGTVIFLNNGIAERVTRDVVLQNGLLLRPDGSMTTQTGGSLTLRSEQFITPSGTIQAATPGELSVVTTTISAAPAASATGSDLPPMKKQGEEVGISAVDGISVSGADAIITRNGVSERLAQSLDLSDGSKIRPDGVLTRPDGSEITLRANQVLSFDGILRDLPPNPNTNPGTPTRQSPQ